MWKFRNMPLNNPCVQEEITIKIRKYFGLQKKKKKERLLHLTLQRVLKTYQPLGKILY